MATYVEDFFEFNSKTTFLTSLMATILKLKSSSRRISLHNSFILHYTDMIVKSLIISSMPLVLETVGSFKSKFFVMFIK